MNEFSLVFCFNQRNLFQAQFWRETRLSLTEGRSLVVGTLFQRPMLKGVIRHHETHGISRCWRSSWLMSCFGTCHFSCLVDVLAFVICFVLVWTHSLCLPWGLTVTSSAEFPLVKNVKCVFFLNWYQTIPNRSNDFEQVSKRHLKIMS